jgi:hypothetical protein
VKLLFGMAGCEHKSCGGSEKVWLPYFYRGRERGLKPHPFCADCGLVKNLSSERPRDLGYYMNVLSVLGQSYKIVQVQKHLVAMEMDRLALEDGYGMDRKMQEKLFVEIVTRILNVPERAVTVILEAPP